MNRWMMLVILEVVLLLLVYRLDNHEALHYSVYGWLLAAVPVFGIWTLQVEFGISKLAYLYPLLLALVWWMSQPLLHLWVPSIEFVHQLGQSPCHEMLTRLIIVIGEACVWLVLRRKQRFVN